MVEQAYFNLSQVTKADLSEIKALKQPPTQLREVFSAVMVLLGKKTKWDEIKKEIGKADFLTRLNNVYTKRDEIAPAALTKLNNYLTQEGFKNDNMGAISQCAERMQQFVLAIAQYHKVLTVVQNKQLLKDETEKHLLDAQNEFGEDDDEDQSTPMSQDVPVG